MFALFLPTSFSLSYNRSQSPVGIVNQVNEQANKKKSQQIQNTKYDDVSSDASTCHDFSLDGRFTIARTLCSLKELSRNYLQYVMYIWLAAATIFIIRNWFQIVTSTDKEKQLWTFKKNILYIIIWVVLLIGFYYILDLFVSVVNLIAE